MTYPNSNRLVPPTVIVIALLCLLPLVWTTLAAFGFHPNLSTKPPSWVGTVSIENFLDIGLTEPNFVREIANSFMLATSTTFVAEMVAFGMAYALARSSFRGNMIVAQSMFVLACLPTISYVIPLAEVMNFLHLYDQLIGLILAEAALYAPLAAYILLGYIRHVPLDFEDAARLDGATLWQTIRLVVLPSIGSGITATGIIVFVLSWNQLLMPLILSARTKTIPVAMIDFFTFERDMEWPIAAAALISSLLPILIVVIIGHRPLEHFSLGQEAREL